MGTVRGIMALFRAFQAEDGKRLKDVTPIRQSTELLAVHTHGERSHVSWHR
jgi:hypothetical protein